MNPAAPRLSLRRPIKYRWRWLMRQYGWLSSPAPTIVTARSAGQRLAAGPVTRCPRQAPLDNQNDGASPLLSRAVRHNVGNPVAVLPH